MEQKVMEHKAKIKLAIMTCNAKNVKEELHQFIHLDGLEFPPHRWGLLDEALAKLSSAVSIIEDFNEHYGNEEQ